MNTKSASQAWSLEVVRGKDVGRRFALNGGAMILGNALGAEPGLDLSSQEGNAPRRMAAKQAELDCSGPSLVLRDLDSPGGTFVNRQRLLPGQARALQPDDVIQLGGVQLKVVAGSSNPSVSPAPKAAPTPPKSGPLPAPFNLASGAVCRSWDDFLVIAAQRWPAMREELTSGRLAAFFIGLHRPDLAPSPQAPGNPDERLDAWLGSLPTTRPSQPELDVHPQTLHVRVASGGGMTRQTLRITNTGYRLLRSSIRVDASGASWLKVASAFAGMPFVTVDQTDVPIDLEVPESLDRPLSTTLVIDSNGGTRRVEVRLERSAASVTVPAAGPAPAISDGLRASIARRPPAVRAAVGALGGILLRLLVAIGALWLGGASAEIPLAGGLVMLALAGAAVCTWLAPRRGEPRDLPLAAFAGAFAGALASAVVVSVGRTLEPLLGARLAASTPVVCLLWAGLGAALAAVSVLLVPFQPATEDRK